MAINLIREFDPAVVVGFGGYPSLPSLLAAGATKRPRVLHEQNAVLGRVNRLVARWVSAIATSSPETQRLPASASGKVGGYRNPPLIMSWPRGSKHSDVLIQS